MCFQEWTMKQSAHDISQYAEAWFKVGIFYGSKGWFEGLDSMFRISV